MVCRRAVPAGRPFAFGRRLAPRGRPRRAAATAARPCAVGMRLAALACLLPGAALLAASSAGAWPGRANFPGGHGSPDGWAGMAADWVDPRRPDPS